MTPFVRQIIFRVAFFPCFSGVGWVAVRPSNWGDGAGFSPLVLLPAMPVRGYGLPETHAEKDRASRGGLSCER
jgi:hypothetical protein